MDAVAKKMQFEYDFPLDWDAFIDTLEDVEWVCTPEGYVLVLGRADAFVKNAGDDFAIFLAATRQGAHEWHEQGRPFHLFVTGGTEVRAAMQRFTDDICLH